jgi:hypothetical protein
MGISGGQSGWIDCLNVIKSGRVGCTLKFLGSWYKIVNIKSNISLSYTVNFIFIVI